ncbi:PAS domain-containing sensor histidine kinase [Candidatus Berkelbacteria bacterium]|nr:PAS domain-containing sensor histidine kinase [Candidatus Berkelbacteria bacterium]
MRVEKELKKELVQIKDFLLSLVAALPAGVIAIDRKGTVIAANQKALEFLGKREAVDRIIDKDIFSLTAALPDLEKKLQECIRHRRSDVFIPVLRIAKEDKNSFLSVIGKPIAHGMLILLEDITHLRATERLARREAEFASLASHQLRTPVTGIQWTAEILAKKEKLNAAGKGYVQDIMASAKRLNTLVKLLLTASRIEAGRVKVEPQPTDLVNFIRAELTKSEVYSEKKQLKCSFSSHPEKLVALVDQNLLEQIIQNLVGNAIDYTPAGGEIAVSLEGKKNVFIFQVRDTGIGIPEQDQATIFERFNRSDNAVRMKPDGTGLGLYIVSEAVKLLGGKIWFESPTLKKERTGTAFYVELPLQARAKEVGKHLVDHPFE